MKAYTTEAVNSFLADIREKREKYLADKSQLKAILDEGNAFANDIANETLNEVRKAMGMSY